MTQGWFAVRSVIAFGAESDRYYEERVTLWKCSSFDEAIERAEREAASYAQDLSGASTGLAQAFHLFVDDASPGDGAEVFSLFRRSDLEPSAYLDQFFDTGEEFQGETT